MPAITRDGSFTAVLGRALARTAGRAATADRATRLAAAIFRNVAIGGVIPAIPRAAFGVFMALRTTVFATLAGLTRVIAGTAVFGLFAGLGDERATLAVFAGGGPLATATIATRAIVSAAALGRHTAFVPTHAPAQGIAADHAGTALACLGAIRKLHLAALPVTAVDGVPRILRRRT